MHKHWPTFVGYPTDQRRICDRTVYVINPKAVGCIYGDPLYGTTIVFRIPHQIWIDDILDDACKKLGV